MSTGIIASLFVQLHTVCICTITGCVYITPAYVYIARGNIVYLVERKL